MNVIFHCTKKALTEFKIKNAPNLIPVSNAPFWNSWYCNVIKLGRQKWFLFTNTKTLLSFMVAKGRKDASKTLEIAFRFYLAKTLESEGLPLGKIHDIVSNINGIVFSKTSNRSVLGTMNDIAFHYLFGLTRTDEYRCEKFEDLVKSINDLPMGALKYDSPSRFLRKLLQAGDRL